MFNYLSFVVLKTYFGTWGRGLSPHILSLAVHLDLGGLVAYEILVTAQRPNFRFQIWS